MYESSGSLIWSLSLIWIWCQINNTFLKSVICVDIFAEVWKFHQKFVVSFHLMSLVLNLNMSRVHCTHCFSISNFSCKVNLAHPWLLQTNYFVGICFNCLVFSSFVHYLIWILSDGIFFFWSSLSYDCIVLYLFVRLIYFS